MDRRSPPGQVPETVVDVPFDPSRRPARESRTLSSTAGEGNVFGIMQEDPAPRAEGARVESDQAAG